MKLIIRDFVASLKERGELDAILPDLLSEVGFTVFSRPGIGTVQHGVDIAAVGTDQDGERKVFLLSVKQGDLTRQDWDGNPQALRPSLNEIQDAYIPNRIPPRYRDLKVVICICIGGSVQEQVRDVLTGHIMKNQTSRIAFDEWNGDHIAEMLMTGLLREQVLPKPLRRSFQKSIAMVDEPDVSFKHFRHLALALKREAGDSQTKRVRAARQINFALWVLYVWARDADNLDASYRASELSTLLVWDMLRPFIGKRTKNSRAIVQAQNQIIQLHIRISFEFLEAKVLPHAEADFALSAAVRSRYYADVNLRLFDVLGRLALAGLWLAWSLSRDNSIPSNAQAEALRSLANKTLSLINANPALLTPLKDDHAIEVALCVLFFAHARADFNAIRGWLADSSAAIDFSIRAHNLYPTINGVYRDLLHHPRERSDEFRKNALPGSVLLPLLGCWLTACGCDTEFERLAGVISEELPECTLQFWFPDSRTEDGLYEGIEQHGSALTDISFADGGDALLDTVWECCEEFASFDTISCVETGYWPIFLLACRHHRLPVPPQFWIEIVRGARQQRAMPTGNSV